MDKSEELLQKLITFYPDKKEEIEKVYSFAKEKHENQYRISGEPYITHPLEVSLILANLGFDVITIKSAILHDVIEDCNVSYEEIEKNFGKVIATIVNGVTKISTMKKSEYNKTQSSKEAKYESFIKFILAISEDIRVVLVKLADRLHNMRTLECFTSSKRKKYAKETMDIYVPLANRLGLTIIKSELEDLCFKYINPQMYYKIKNLVEEKKAIRETKIKKAIDYLKKKLQPYKVPMIIQGRPKHFYSIYRKMKLKGLSFDEIFDLLGIRIITDTKEHCYLLLGLIHSIWSPIGNRFKDYIASPKPNNYQSLHTTVINPEGELIEIQIRTKEMHEIAEKGIAAHWAYKEENMTISPKDKSLYSFFRELIETTKQTKSAKESYENIKNNLLKNTIFVRTPKGKVIELPQGATPVDFAYAIHSEVGNTCVGAKVNGKMVPLSYKLKTEDIVYIITNKNSHPSPDWLEFVKTSKARNRIKQWIKHSLTDFFINEAKNMLSKSLKDFDLTYNKFLKQYLTPEGLKKLNYKDVDTLLVDIGRNKIKISTIFSKLGLVLQKSPSSVSIEKKDFELTNYQIEGIENIEFQFAKCCCPKPFDKIVGILSNKRISLHKYNCKNLKNVPLDKIIHLKWKEKKKNSLKISKETLIRIKIEPSMINMFEKLSTIKYHIGKCCNPSLKDEIRGFFTKARRGISVHKKNCYHIQNKIKQAQKIFEMKFENFKENSSYVRILVKFKEKYLLKKILEKFLKYNFWLVNFKKEIIPKKYQIEFLLSVNSLKKSTINDKISSLEKDLRKINENIVLEYQSKPFSSIFTFINK